MQFTPKTQEEIKKELNEARGILADGVYDFEIATAEETVSKAGNPMIKIKLLIWDHNGNQRIVWDYLLTDNQFKILSLCIAIKMADQYEKGEINAEQLTNKTGKVKIGTQKDTTGQYGDRNVAREYMPAEAGAGGGASNVAVGSKPAPGEQKTSITLDDEIPF